MTYNYGLIINFRKTHCRCTILYYVTVLLWNHILVNEESRSLFTHFEKKINFFFIFNPALVHRQKNLFITFFFLHVRNRNFGSRLMVCRTIFHWWWQFGFSIFPKMYLRRQWEKRKRKNAHHSYYFLLLINYIIRCWLHGKVMCYPMIIIYNTRKY